MRLLSLNLVLIVVLSACGGGSSSAGLGTRNSAFVGQFPGTTTLVVTRGDNGAVVSTGSTLTSFVTANGMVYVANASAVLGAAPLVGDRLVITWQARDLLGSALWACQGELRLTAGFALDPGGTAVINGNWQSKGLACNGVPIQLHGTLSGVRDRETAAVSQVLESDHEALIGAINDVLGRER